MIGVITVMRSRHSMHDFADEHRPPTLPDTDAGPVSPVARSESRSRILGRPFVTAGWVVITLGAVVFAVEVALLVLVLRIPDQT